MVADNDDYRYPSSLTINVDDEAVLDGDIEVTVEKNGAAIELKELAKGDVIAIATAFETEDYGKNSNEIGADGFIKVLATDETIKGMVLDYDDDYRTYTIGEKAYKYVGYTGEDLKVATTYELMLDPFGRILDSGDAVASGAKFAIVEKYDDKSEKVSVLLADGTSASYEVYKTAVDLEELTKKVAGKFVKAVQERVVMYTLRNGAIDIKRAVEGEEVDGEYNTKTNKLAFVDVVDELNIVDARQHEKSSNNTPSISDYAKFDASALKADVDYTAYAFKDEEVYSFVVITKIGTVFTEESRFAVITRDPASKIYDGSTCAGVEALYNGEAITLYFDKKVDDVDVKQGDVVFFTTDSEGYVESIHTIYNKDGQFAGEDVFAGNEEAYKAEDWNFSFKKMPADIQLVNGYVADVKNNSITLAVANDGIIDGNKYNDRDGEVGMFTFGIDDECQAYIFDEGYDVNYDYKKYAAIDASAIIESNLVERIEDGEEVDYEYDVEESSLNDAVALVVNGDVVCIFVNYPEA
jgi:hypothetical protein